ncbi:MAG: MBL fold metallo-hydrolase [Gemmatimonadetes bacterium]|nr:MBL fold metallo-hydrolase [Gemmatimonadota bacterium]
MYDALEDEFGDVVGKARRGQERTTADVGSASGLSAADIERLEAYDLVPSPEQVLALAHTLGLAPEKLHRAAAVEFLPDEPGGREPIDLVVEMRVLGTDFLMNGYVVGGPRTKVGAIVDPGFQADRILQAAEGAQLDIAFILLTHGHFDHVGALAEIRQATQADVLASEAEMELLGDLRQHVDGYLVPGELIEMGRQSLRVAATPGHTPAGVSLIHAEAAFVGDALFAGSVGGTRNRSDYKRQLAAVQSELLSLPEGTTLYPGHGPATTVAEELANNPFFTD